MHWRSITPDNATHLFGQTVAARVADPRQPARVFSWLLEESRDDRGNIVRYEYKQENLEGVNVNAPEERPRLTETTVQAQRYLKRIRYGNAAPFQPGGWLFEVVLDYGEHGTTQGSQLDITPAEARPWSVRPDTFSTFRSGFELRTRRLCRRVLMFHRFPELGPEPTLVASTDLLHDEDPSLTRLVGVFQRSYEREETTGFYNPAELPRSSSSTARRSSSRSPTRSTTGPRCKTCRRVSTAVSIASSTSMARACRACSSSKPAPGTTSGVLAMVASGRWSPSPAGRPP